MKKESCKIYRRLTSGGFESGVHFPAYFYEDAGNLLLTNFYR